jgi:hypothetical protein
VIAELARIAKGRVLVLAHVKELVEQNHQKYESYGLPAGIFSASLKKKDRDQKAIFGGVQSVARAPEEFFNQYFLFAAKHVLRLIYFLIVAGIYTSGSWHCRHWYNQGLLLYPACSFSHSRT